MIYEGRSSIDGTLANQASFSTNLSAGNHTIYFKVQDDKGAWSSEVSANLTVLPNKPPIAVASAYPTLAFVGEEVVFSSGGSYDPDGTIASYVWQFGYGGISSEANPVHTYIYPGNYTVLLTVWDDKGAYDSTVVGVEVKCNPPSGITIDIKNNYNKESFLQAIRARLVYISPYKYHYIDVDINATVLGNLNFDTCINNVKGEFKNDVNENKTFERTAQNIYFHNYVTSPLYDNLVGILTDWLVEKVFGKVLSPLSLLEQELNPPKVYLRNMYVTYNAGPPSPLQSAPEGEVYPFYFGNRYRLPSYLDALHSAVYSLPTWYPRGIIGIRANSPVDISVIDPLGREIGAFYENNSLAKEIIEIPGIGIYTGSKSEPQYIIIADPIEGIYSLKVHGTGNGTYNLTISWLYNDTIIYKEIYSDIPISVNETYDYILPIDNTPPHIEIAAPINGTTINTKDITISWNASDNVALNYFEVLLDNVSYINTSKTSITLLNLSEGSHSIEVKAYDLANNSASDLVSFVVDITSPEISEFKITPTSGYTCTVYNFSAKVNDETSGVKEVIGKLISSNSSSALNITKENSIYSGSISNLQSSNYFIEIAAEDNAGNLAFTTTPFNVTSYVLDWLTPLNLSKSFNLGSTIPIKFTLHDKLNGSFVSDYSVRVEVFNPADVIVFSGVYGDRDTSVRINPTEEYYITNMHTDKTWVTGNYTIKSVFGANPCDSFEKIITLENKGGGKR